MERSFKDEFTQRAPSSSFFRMRATVVKIGDDKNDYVSIGTGATHHFFFDKMLFKNYSKIPRGSIESAIGSCTVIGKAEITLPILGSLSVEAFDAPDLQNHVLFFGWIDTTTTFCSQKRCTEQEDVSCSNLTPENSYFKSISMIDCIR